MNNTKGCHQKQYNGCNPGMTLEDLFQAKHGRILRSELIEDIEHGDYNEYLEEYWEYIEEYGDD